MEFKLEEYKPIDYKIWILGEEARRGVNIKRLNLLTDDELRILNESVPYQDQRDDPGHGEMTAYFVLKLLNFLPGKREIVVPAGILHDTGWFGNDPNEWMRLVNQNRYNLQELAENEAIRRPHQNRGIFIAARVLERTGYFNIYSLAYGLEIADIIGDHDTKKLPASNNGKIVIASDLLWRVTYPHAQIYMPNDNPEYIVYRTKETCLSDKFFQYLGKIGNQIARVEFVNMMCFKFPESAPRFVEREFREELEFINH